MPGGVSGVIVAVLAALPLVAFAAWKRWHHRPRAGRVLVRYGAGGFQVALERAVWVLPFIHHAVWVPLAPIRVVIARAGREALWTADHLYLDVRAVFELRVPPDRDAVATVLGVLGSTPVSPEGIEKWGGYRMREALRASLPRRTLAELVQVLPDVCNELRDALMPRMQAAGFGLLRVGIESLDLSPREAYDDALESDRLGLASYGDAVRTMRAAGAPLAAWSTEPPEPERAPGARLRLQPAQGGAEIYEIGSHPFRMGSAAVNDLILPGAEMASHHAGIVWHQGHYELQVLGDDLAPAQVNGTETRQALLRPNDEIRLGDARMRFETD